MSVHFKAKQFAEEAKELERQLFDEQGNLREQPETTPEPETPEAPASEAVVEAPPAVVPDPKVVEEDKYKAAVKAMNEAQREAAELRKAQKDQEYKQVELEKRLSELVEERKRPVVQDFDDELESDLPDVAKLSERKARQVMDPVLKELEDIKRWRHEQESTAVKAREEQSALLMRQEVLKQHADFDEVVNSEAMQKWIENEAPPVYKKIYDGSIPFDTKDVVQVLNHFKSTLVPAKVVADKPSDKASVKTPVNPTSKPTKPASVTPEELTEFKNKGHRWSPEKRAEFTARLDSMFT